jgi:arylsulfatase A
MNRIYKFVTDHVWSLDDHAITIWLIMFIFSYEIWATELPNVIIIYGDDVGFGDVGVYGSTQIPTPNIDKLSASSLRFTDGHSTAATCTPSRFSLLTGVHGFRHGVRILPPNAPLSIPLDSMTLPKLFRKAGYHTAVIGKWHLGIGEQGTPTDWNNDVKPGPLEIGFDYSFLLPSTNDRVPCVYLENHRVVGLDPKDPLYVGESPNIRGLTVYPDGRKNLDAMTYYRSSHGHNNSVINGIGRIGYMTGGKSALWDDETMADVFVDTTNKFIKNRDKKKPFFLYFASQDIHVPRTPHPRFKGKSNLGYRGDAMVQLDWTTGQIIQILEKHGLRENTIVIFSSDNGPVYDDGYKDGTEVNKSSEESDRGHDGSGQFRGGKYQIYEGGTRVPFIVSWPKRIKPGISNALISQIDLLASFACLFNVVLKDHEAIDSRNMLPTLLGEDPNGSSELIEEAKNLALRKGQWKYIMNKAGRSGLENGALYNLKDDIGEKTNVAGVYPKVAGQLNTLLLKLKGKKGIRALTRSVAE